MLIPPSLIPGLNVKWAIGILLILSAAIAGYSHGRKTVKGEIAEAERDIAIAYAGEIVARQNIADGLSTDNAKLRATQAPRDRLITKEITRYVEVTRPADRCTLPGPWRLRHDAAATGQPPAAEAGPLAAGAADPVDDAAALETIGANYAVCREDQAKLAGWQRRYNAQEAAE